MLHAILMVTLCVPDLGAAERAYVDQLGYAVATRGPVSAALADSWGAPLAAGSRSLLLRAPASPEFTLRLVEQIGRAHV